MAEESSQQFTSTGTTSARNVSPTKASSVRPVNRQPIKQVSSNTQSPQTKYIYAGIGEQPLTQREFDENLKNLRSTLAEVESLLHGDMKNPENIKRCQQLLGFATSLRLPQEVKDKEIRSYPPAVQHLYETVKNEGSSASPAAQMAQTRHATTAMAQIMASDLRHETILKDLQTMDIDSVYDKYYGVQHEQDMIAMAESHRKFMDLLDMPLDTPEQRAEFERKAAAHLEEDRKRHEQELERKKREWEEIQRTKQRDPERGAELERKWFKNNQEKIAILKQHNQQLQKELDSLPKDDPRRKKLEIRIQENKQFTSRLNNYLGGDASKPLGQELPGIKTATMQFKQEELDSLPKDEPRRKAIEEKTQGNKLYIEANGPTDLNSERVVEVQKEVADTPVTHLDVAMTTQPKNLNGVGKTTIKIPTNAPSVKMAQSPSDQALTSMGSDRGIDDLNLGITPGGKVGLMPTMPRRRSTGFNRNAIASTNRGFDLGTVGLVSTTTPKVPQKPVKDATESKIAVSKQTDMDNSLEKNNTHNLTTPKKGIADLNASLEGASSGKPINLEADINILNIRSQQSQATV
ncbi:MAG: hypothetical protein IKJ28_03320 [Alphaproteobacteria bacterium]|nr:hypothetical protein [Alphaproteobacteria bacterium]